MTATITKAKSALRKAQKTVEVAAANPLMAPEAIAKLLEAEQAFEAVVIEMASPRRTKGDAMQARIQVKPRPPQAGPAVTFAQSRVYALLRAAHDTRYRWTIAEVTDCLLAEKARLQA